MTTATIYRFKFTEEFSKNLHIFSLKHQHDDRKIFKQAWDIWIDENKEMIKKETTYLEEAGYKGDIQDKMFKSARYYFRKKPETEKKELKKRHQYKGIGKELLHKMDIHIQVGLRNDMICFKPSNGFEDFCYMYIKELQEEVNVLVDCGMTDPIDIMNKIKKTYKNRYFMITTDIA